MDKQERRRRDMEDGLHQLSSAYAQTVAMAVVYLYDYEWLDTHLRDLAEEILTQVRRLNEDRG